MIEPSPPGTKERMLDAAERLFAERGFAATSLRAITAAAGVNLAAVNYHFHSKEALLAAVFARRLGPLNRQRLELLAQARSRAGRRSPPLEEILEAFLAPAFRLHGDLAPAGPGFPSLMGRIYAEPGEHIRVILREQFGEIAARFTEALKEALPKLPPAELYWRIHFMIGAMAHTLAGSRALGLVAGGRCDPPDVEGTIRRLVVFLAAGLRAPAARRTRRSRTR